MYRNRNYNKTNDIECTLETTTFWFFKICIQIKIEKV